MKSILKFVKTTITGGLLFLIPVMIVLIVLTRALRWMRPLLRPLVRELDVETWAGVTVLTLLCILALCVICFIAGISIKLEGAKRMRKWFEDIVLKFLPGFEYLKVWAGDQDGAEAYSHWKPCLLQDGDAWVIAFIVDQQSDGHTTVFVPEAPRAEAGNSKIVATASIHIVPLTMKEALFSLRHFGAGLSHKIPAATK